MEQRVSYVSTAGAAPPADLRTALHAGLAPDGGLYLPSPLAPLPPGTIAAMRDAPWTDVARAVARHLLEPELDRGTVDAIVREALDFPLPLVPLTDRVHVLELFHGPTGAFKDVGAQFLARALAATRAPGEATTVLTATSGDTGGAVAHAFLGLRGIRVVVLFPEGKVSTRQERQFSTLGENVQAVAVQGDFDDCQRMAKDAFRDPEIRGAVSLSSANSINIGRFLPQSFYFVHAWGAIRSRREEGPEAPGPTSPASPILFSVPSGNFGNLAAGLTASAMGLPDVTFLAATNANDVVPRLLKSGRFRPRPSLRTLSTAMDVGNPSNLDRILHLYHRDLNRLRRDLTGASVTDPETRDTIRRVYEEHGHVLDPHTAVGFAALERELDRRPDATGVLLATASPAKFAEVVEPILGVSLPVPEALARGLAAERRVTPMAPESVALKDFLMARG